MSEFETTGIKVGGVDVTVDITTQEREKEAETVHLHAHDAAVRALQAIAHRRPPDECNGMGVGVNWDRIFEILDEQEAGR